MKKIVVICTVVFLAGFALYRYGGLRATFEEGAEKALIKKRAEDCKKQCPTRASWQQYCNQKEKRCLDDVRWARLEGRPEAEIQQLIKACADQKVKDLASYKDETACKQRCQQIMDEELSRIKKNK